MKKTILILVLVFLAPFNKIFAQTNPAISNITDNQGTYPNNQIPTYEKLEITFQATTAAGNYFLPYTASPPAGLNIHDTGVTVDGLFLPPGQTNWAEAYVQPAFYYQDFDHQIKANGSTDWIYPKPDFSWKIRFAPTQIGSWQYRLRIQDGNGTSQTNPVSFTVTSSINKGFIKVSQTDPRYFEYSNGSYFPALGYNMNYDQVNWINPTADTITNLLQNPDHFRTMGQNGIQLVRIWLSQWAIFGSSWNPWKNFSNHGGDPPLEMLSSLTGEYADGEHEIALIVSTTAPCVFHGSGAAWLPVKRNTNYRLRVLYNAVNMTPNPTGTAGFTVKYGQWVGCEAATEITPPNPANTNGWQWLEGTINSGNQDFIPHLYFSLLNMSSGRIRIAEAHLYEILPDSSLRADIIQKPRMDHHRYADQRNSYAFDKVVDMAKDNGVYLRPVTLDHREWIFNHTRFDGQPTDDFTGGSNPPNPSYLYGDVNRSITKNRFMQMAWWRYLQARWGYSTAIQSWEYVNEGTPGVEHAVAADEFGKYFDQFKGNQHLAATSVWSGTTADWSFTNYPGIDFADGHRYISNTNLLLFNDSAEAVLNASASLGVPSTGGRRPAIRGETGFIEGSETNNRTTQLFYDTEGIWLHKFLWATLNANALIESYWYVDSHIYCLFNNPTACPNQYDHRPVYKTVFDFIKTVPLTNGHYQDLAPTISNLNLRVVGQKDTANGNAYLWIDNKNHTWKKVVDQVEILPVSGIITVSGFLANQTYQIEEWDTYTGTISSSPTLPATVTANSSGSVILNINSLTTDLAVKISSSAPTHCTPLGNIDCTGTVSVLDLSSLINKFGTNDVLSDLDDSGIVNILDLSILLSNFGK